MTWIDELDALENGATPGPWVHAHEDGEPTDLVVTADEELLTTCEDGPHDAVFVAFLRNAAQRLIAIARAAEEAVAPWLADDERKARLAALRKALEFSA